MSKKKKLLISLSIIIAVAFVAGVTAVATSTYGSQSDPLVALSYLDDTVTPSIMSRLETMINEKISGISVGGTTTVTNGQEFSVVSLTNGQTLTCSVGTEIMLRIGSAVSAGSSSPRLVDETTGSSVTSSGTALTQNHMYMVTIKGNGIKATSSVKVLVRGDYTIS